MMQRHIYYYARNGAFGWVEAKPGLVLAKGLTRITLKVYRRNCNQPVHLPMESRPLAHQKTPAAEIARRIRLVKAFVSRQT